MKNYFLLLVCLYTTQITFGQVNNITFSCSYTGTTEVISDFAFENDDLEDSDYDVKGLVKEILDAFYMPPDKISVIMSSQVNNANAVMKEGVPYILYSKYFIKDVTGKENGDWRLKGIFAHEVAHHVLFHTTQGGGSQVNLELEADKWAGSALYKLGATLEEATACVNETKESGSSTHPPRIDRLSAVKMGWLEARKKEPKTFNDETLEEEIFVEDEAIEEEVIEEADYETTYTMVEDSRSTIGCELDEASNCYSLDISYPEDIIYYEIPLIKSLISFIFGSENQDLDVGFNQFLNYVKDNDYGDLYSESRSIEIEYQDISVLSVSMNETGYSGGTVSYDKLFWNFDLETGKTIGLKDILNVSNNVCKKNALADFVYDRYIAYWGRSKPKKEQKPEAYNPNDSYLIALAIKYFKKDQGIDENTSIQDSGYFSEPFGDGNFYLNNNFCFTEKGLLFSYSKYEIASGSAGMPQFVIPYEDLKPILTENSLILSFIWGGAE